MGSVHSSLLEALDSEFPLEPCFFHFSNLSNTCFCNSVLQSLTNSDYIHKFFKSLLFEEKSNESMPDICWNASKLKKAPLVQFLDFYEKQFISKKREFYIKPKRFLHFIRKETDQFPRGEQHDSHEFLMFLLNSFDNTINDINNSFSSSSSSSSKFLKSFKHSKNNNKQNRNNNQENNNNINNDVVNVNSAKVSKFSSLFEGKKEICFKCTKCESTTCLLDSFCCLYIGLEGVPNNRSLQDLIDKSFNDEILSGDNFWECNNCHEKQNAKFSSCLTVAPKVLVVQLQRFYFNKKTNSVSKMKNYVQIRKKVKLNRNNEIVNYSLKSIIIHFGRKLQEGHYITLNYVCGSWILANDNQLHVLSSADLGEYIGPTASQSKSAPAPYLLFYERLN